MLGFALSGRDGFRVVLCSPLKPGQSAIPLNANLRKTWTSLFEVSGTFEPVRDISYCDQMLSHASQPCTTYQERIVLMPRLSA